MWEVVNEEESSLECPCHSMGMVPNPSPDIKPSGHFSGVYSEQDKGRQASWLAK